MSRILLLLIITYLVAHVMGVSATRSRLNARTAAQQQTEADLLLEMLTDADLDEQELAELYDAADMDGDLDADADMDMNDYITEPDPQTTSFLESMAAVSTHAGAGVSYIAFGDKGLQGGNTEYGVTLNGQPCGVAVGVTGGLPYFDIVEETNLETGLQTKKFGKKNVATINIAFDRPNPVLTKWIKETLDGKYALRNGAVQADDGKSNLKASLSFEKGYMSEVTFPRFSLDDHTPAIWKIKISPESTHLNQADDGALSEFRDKDKKFKPFANNFRFYIGDQQLKGVRLIESFVVKTRRAVPDKNITPLYSVGNLVFEISQAEAGDLFLWMEKQHATKKNGAISVYKPSGKLFYSISLKGMGIYKVHPMRAKPRSMRWLRVEIFVEQVKFDFDPKSSKNKAGAAAAIPDAPALGDDTKAVADGDDSKAEE